jgi:hypothetical protein
VHGACCPGLFNPSGVQMLFRSMTTGSVASRRNPWLFVCNRWRGMSLLTGNSGADHEFLSHWRVIRKGVQTRLRSYLAAAYSAEVAFGYEGRACVSPHFLRTTTIRRRTVGANPCIRPCLKGRHAGLPLRVRAVLVFRALLVMTLSFSSFPRRRESRSTGTCLPYRIDPRLRGDDARMGQMARRKAGITDGEPPAVRPATATPDCPRPTRKLGMSETGENVTCHAVRLLVSWCNTDRGDRANTWRQPFGE